MSRAVEPADPRMVRMSVGMLRRLVEAASGGAWVVEVPDRPDAGGHYGFIAHPAGDTGRVTIRRHVPDGPQDPAA